MNQIWPIGTGIWFRTDKKCGRRQNYIPPTSSGDNYMYSGPQVRVHNWKLFFLFPNQNMCCGYSKEPFRWDGSLERTKHMFKLMDRKVIAILRKLFLLNWTYVYWTYWQVARVEKIRLIGTNHVEGGQWLSGKVLDSRPKGRGFEPHRRHCVVVLEQDTFILA